MTERAQALEAALIGAGVLAQEVLASRQNVGNYLRQLAQSVLNDLSTTENIPQPIQRFDLVSVSFAYTSDHEMQRSDDGEWVRFDDVFPPAALSPVEPTVHNDLCSWCLTQADHVAASEECYERNSERGRITTRPPVEPTPEPETCEWRITTGPLGIWVTPFCVEGSIPAPWGTERAKSCHLCGKPLRLVPSEETK